MSPTVFRAAGPRFYFFSREELRMHVHVTGAGGEAKIWLDPEIGLARSHGFDARIVREALKIVHEREEEIRRAWHEHFDG